MYKKCKNFMMMFVSICVLITLNICCTKKVLRVDNYKTVKKEIKEVLCITDVDFQKVIDERWVDRSKWKLESSEMANKYALSVIDSYVQRYFGYSRKHSLVACQSGEFDSIQRKSINTMFQEISSLNNLEHYRLGEGITQLFSNVNNRYVLLISQNGYHYSEEYISRMNTVEAFTTVASTVSLVGAVTAGGFGMGTYIHYKKGISSMSMALLDLKGPKVLFCSRNSFQDDPLADSVMVRQLQSLFNRF